MLDDIKSKLLELQTENRDSFGEAVIYGRATSDNVPAKWNYITFNRTIIKRSGTNSNDYNEYFQINLVHEDYVPEENVYKIITKLGEITGLKLASNDIEFNYIVKNRTDMVVEVATITFTHPVKGYLKR